MNEQKHVLAGTVAGRVTVPIVLSTVLAISIFLDQFLAVAGVIAGASLILLIIRWVNQRNEPLNQEIVEIVLRHEAQDSAWMEGLRQKHRDANEATMQVWRQNASAVWIFLAALFIKLGYLVVVALLRFFEQYFATTGS
jgi:hypothetical protein